MNKKIRFSLLTLLVMLCGTVFAQEETPEVTLDFTSNTSWGLPVGSGNGAQASASFSDGTYSITLAATTKYYFNSDGYLMLGKSGSSLTLPAFSFDVEKIVVVGNTNASADVKQNFYVGDNAVSTETKGAKSSNTYEIAETYQAAGNVYTLKVTSAHNTQITKIEIYKKASAEPEPEPYTVDFNSTISTSSHDFVVASNWGHIVGSNNYDGSGPYYMQYSYTADGGVDGTGALRVMAQNGYYAGSTQSEADFTDGHYDYLITPKVNGTVTLQVKRYNVTGYPSYVKIFKVDDAGTTVGEELTTEITPEITTSEWSTLTLTLTEEQRLAIRAQSVLLDNFTATSANIVKLPAMSIASISRADGESSTYFDGNADGSYTVKYKVKITNTGEVELVSGTTENYSLSVSIDGTLYGTFDIPFDLAVGETSEEFVASIVLPSTAPKGWKYRYLTENLSGTTNTNSLTWSQVLDYNPIAYFIKKGDEPIAKGRTINSETSVNFGMISAETTLDYVVFANNAGDLVVKSIVAPEGFSVQPAQTLPYTIAAHTGMDVSVIANGAATSEGNLEITFVNKNGNDTTITVALSQTVINASKWLADFSEKVWPENTIHQSSLSITSNTYYGFDCAVKSSSSYNNKFISPLLHATAGETFSFDAMLDYNYGTVKVYLTKNRSELGEPVLSLNNTQLNMSSMTNQSFTAETEGDYYVVFEIYNAYIDNLYGFEPVAVTHDIMVNSFVLSGSSAADVTIQSGDAISPKFEILPVKSETADAYTVKLYANNEVVATAESADLVGGTAKSFTFNYTPIVSATTTFNVYAAIEFANDTIIKSDSLKLTVTCEPVFVFFNAGTTVYSYKPSTRTNPITFGKVNEANLVQNFEIYNWGSAPLTVSSITVPEGFTVNVSEATVQPKERQAIDVTFVATATGIYGGNLTIVYTDAEGEKTFELPVSGTLLDATKFYATFGTSSDLNNLPAGSLVQDNVSLSTPSTGNAALMSSSATKNLFITPLVSVTEGEILSFESRSRSSYYDGNVKVYLVSDHVAAASTTSDDEFAALNPVLVGEFAISSSSSNFSTYTATMPSTGNFYVAFKIKDAYVDEIYGLTPVATPAELVIVSSNIPTEAMQNVPSNATLNVLNIGAKEETDYDVLVHIGDQVKVVKGTQPIATAHKLSATGTPINVAIQSPKVGTFPVYVEVKAGDVVVATEPVDVTFTEEVAKNEIAMEVSSTSATSLLHLNWNNSETVNLYSKSVLKGLGLTEGTKISSISFKGYNTGKKNYTTALNVWYEFTDDETQATPSVGKYDTSSMTNALSIAERSWANVEGSSSEYVDLITINFPEPIVYTGQSLRIVVSSEATDYQSGTYFTLSNIAGGGTSYFNREDNADKFANTVAWSSNSKLPAINFALAVEPAIFSGTVKNETGAAIEGATITLVSTDGDNVQYAGTTNAEGAYSINVIQASREYEVTVKAEGYDDQVETIAFNGESKVKNFVVMNGALIDKYFVNAEMNSAEGWTAVTSDGFKDLGAGLIGTYQVRFSPATVDETHLATEYTFGFEARWAGNFASYTQESKVALPAGVYTLTYDVQNVNGDTKNDTYDSRFFVTVGETKFTDEAKEWMAGATSWTGHSLRFAVNEDAKATISLGYGTGELNYSAEITPAIYVSHLALSFKSFAEAAIDDLNAEIAIAEGMLADASKTEGREVFAAAIETAKALRTSDDVAAINAGVETLKAAELAFRVANLPVQEGTYYVYNAYAKKFLSRGDNYGVRAVADDFGLPFNVTVDMTNTTYKLQMYDSKGYYGDDYWMYSDCSGNRVRSYSLEKVDGGFYLHNSNRATAADNRMYVYMKDDADKWAIAGNAIVGDNVGDEAQTVWQFVTAEQRNAIIAANAAAQKTAAFTAAGIAEDATLEVADATELTFKTGSAWIYTAGPNKGGTPGVNDNGTELYQATGNFAQTVENLESGLYKVSIQAFYRGGGNGDVVAAYGQGHDLSTVSLYANGTVIRVNSWAADRAADNNPNSMGDAAALFAEGKYLAEGYAFVGEDKTLSLKVFVPSFIGAGWFIASNVKYAKVDEAVLAGDANLDGEVTASDAIAAVSFALETETPSPKAFKAADVNASGNITVSDAVGIVNIALSEVTSEPSARGDVAENNALALNGNVLALANTTEFVAFQMDVTVAEGTQFRGVELTSRAAGLNVTYNRVADNTYRVVAFSVNKNAIEAGEGAICTFDIVGNKNVQVTNIEFADAAARAYALVLGETTRINGIAAGAADAEYYSVGGVKSDKAQKGMNVVRTADGKVKKVLVK